LGFNPHTNWLVEVDAKNATSRNYIHWLTSLHALCHKDFKQAMEQMGKYHDRYGKKPLKYCLCDLVMLNGKILNTQRPSRKLDTKLHEPFKVSNVLLPTAIKLELPFYGVSQCISYITHQTLSTCKHTCSPDTLTN
jgi:hypothetical protein